MRNWSSLHGHLVKGSTISRSLLGAATGGPESVHRVFEHNALVVTLAVPLRFDAVAADGSFLTAFDPSFPTSCTIEVSPQQYNSCQTTGDPKEDELTGQSLLRQPVFVRFRDILGFWVDMLTGALSGSEPSGRRLGPFCAMEGSDSPLFAIF